MEEINWEKEYKELAEKYEDLLEGLPQCGFSKAGTPPEWVVKEVEDNTFRKGDAQDDVIDILIASDVYGYSTEDLADEIRDYLEITPGMEKEKEENLKSMGLKTTRETYEEFKSTN